MEATTAANSQTATAAPESKDEVDFVVVSNNNNNSYDSNMHKANSSNNVLKEPQFKQQDSGNNTVPRASKSCKKKSSADGTTEHKKNSNKERLSLFSFGKKNIQKTCASGNAELPAKRAEANKYTPRPLSLPCQPTLVPIGTPPRQHKFVKSSSLARFLGNTYNAKKFEKEEQKLRLAANDGKFNTFGGRRRFSGPYLERFKRYAKEEGDAASQPAAADEELPNTLIVAVTDAASHDDLLSLEHFREQQQHGANSAGAKAMRTLSRGLGKLWWRRTHSVDISTPDPEYKVSYLGNVLTGWAKGEGCVEKQLNTLWRNYTQNSKPDVIMRVKVCASGLKATTRQHGLTEYWANRITHCCAPKNFPRVFCWIYRHEGRKLKHELRCHAVLCSKEKIAHDICNILKENLESALREFKREKILKQNARLSLANAAYDNPSLPRRKILLSVGGNNYRPPLERSKSAPKLMAIEEAIGEEDGEEAEETNEPEMKACCQKDSLYPAMTLGRRRCRRGHSIRRTGKARPTFCGHFDKQHNNGNNKDACCHQVSSTDTKEVIEINEEQQRHSYGSDDSDDFDKLLKHNDYDASASLSNELLPYFDRQLHKSTGSNSLGDLSELKDVEDEPLSLLPTINSDPSADPEADYSPHAQPDAAVLGLRRDGVCSDGEEEPDYLDADDMYFRQASILNMLHRNSMRKMANISLSSDEHSSIETNSSAPSQYHHQGQSSISSDASSNMTSVSALNGAQGVHAGATQRKALGTDSDEGSISSGCETASTATANQDDLSLNYRHSAQQFGQQLSSASEDFEPLSNGLLDEEPITAEEIYQRLESRLQGRHNSDATTFSSSSSITLKMAPSPTTSMSGLDVVGGSGSAASTNPSISSSSSTTRTRRARRQREARADDTDSECSDESGYVEYQERDKSSKTKVESGSGGMQSTAKPQPPPKPLPRRLLASNVGATTAV